MASHRTPDGFDIDTAVIRLHSGRMRNFSGNLYDVLNAAKRKMNEMQDNASWLSNAGRLIIQKMNDLQPQFERQREVLNEYCEFLDRTVVEYERVEQTAHMGAAGVGVDGGGSV